MAGFIHMDRDWIEQHVGSDHEHDLEEDFPIAHHSEHPVNRQSARKTDITLPMFSFIALSVARAPTFDGYEKYVEYQVAHNIISNRKLPGVGEMIAWWDEPAPFEKMEEETLLGYTGDRTKDVRYYDSDGKIIEQTPTVSVMLVERLEHQACDNSSITTRDIPVYRRIGIGTMYLARWADAEPKVETVILR
jgi:hypothetical protein